MTVELKPCPFCGAGEATDNNNASFSGVELMAAGADRPYVWCGTCCASARMADTEAEAIAAWNTRAINPAAIRAAALREAAALASARWAARREHADRLFEMDYPEAATDAKTVSAKADEAEMIADEILALIDKEPRNG